MDLDLGVSTNINDNGWAVVESKPSWTYHAESRMYHSKDDGQYYQYNEAEGRYYKFSNAEQRWIAAEPANSTARGGEPGDSTNAEAEQATTMLHGLLARSDGVRPRLPRCGAADPLVTPPVPGRHRHGEATARYGGLAEFKHRR